MFLEIPILIRSNFRSNTNSCNSNIYVKELYKIINCINSNINTIRNIGEY